MTFKKTTLIAAAAAALCLGANAQESKISFSGFGTVAATTNDNQNVDFVGNRRQPTGAGYTGSTSFAPDSILGLQANWQLTPTVSAIAQATVQHNYDSTANPQVEWAFAKWQATPSFDLNLGRTALPVFMVSDSRLVGYSNMMVRPPIDVYFQVPLTSIDGLSANWRGDTGLGQLTLSANAGATEQKYPTSTVKGKDILAVAANLESGAFTWRAGYSEAKLTYDSTSLNSLLSGLTQYGDTMAGFGMANFANEAYAARDFLAIDARKMTFAGIGVSYDKDNWLAQAEYTQRKGGSLVADTTGWHASVGYRVGKFTPYIGVSQVKTDNDFANGSPQLTVTGATASTLNGYISKAYGTSGLAQASTTLGVKWNFRPDMDVKFQYDDIRFKQGTTGSFYSNGAASGSGAGIATIALDFVF